MAERRRIRVRMAAPVAGMRDCPRHPLGDLMDYVKIFQASAQERITYIRRGVQPREIADLAKAMDLSQSEFVRMIGLPMATIRRRMKDKRPLDTNSSERVVAVAKLIGQVQLMVQQSGDPDGFNAAKWLSSWVRTPNPALNRKTPGSFLDTAEGVAFVSDLIDRMATGAYS